MEHSFASRAKQRTLWSLNRLALFVYGVWVGSVLRFRRGIENTLRALWRLGKAATGGRIALVLFLAVSLAAPAALYLLERSRLLAKERAYRSLALTSATETNLLRSHLTQLLSERATLASLLLDAGYTVEGPDATMVKVVATGYSSTVIETDDTPFVTAANTRVRPGIIALSRDLLMEYTPGAPFSFGDRVRVSGLGDFIVEDSMNARWTRRMDIWFPSRGEAFRFGLRHAYLSKSPAELLQITGGFPPENTD